MVRMSAPHGESGSAPPAESAEPYLKVKSGYWIISAINEKSIFSENGRKGTS